jgi:type I restriction enzyme S subunit
VEVKPGYKQTEAGIIPEDWRIQSIEQISTVGRGRVISHREIARSLNPRYPVYSSQTSDNGVMGYLDTFEFEGEYITWTTDGANAGTVFARNGRFNCTNVCGTIKLKSDNHFFVAKVLGKIAPRHVSRHLGNPKLMNDVMKRIKIPLPPTKAEQEAIAASLSNADGHIESLEQLVAKKRSIKQGTMQELLTGKKRLPGYSGKWGVKRLGEILRICHGKSQRNVGTQNGLFPVLATGGEIGRANRFLYDKPSVLIGRKGTIDQPQYMDTPFWTVDTLFYSIVHEPNHAKFIFYRFCLIDWKQYNEASGVPSLNARTIESIKISSPGPDEQTAIATILSDMDAEIATLEMKLVKVHQLKQGMMQELLAGRIRLV